MKRMTLPRTAPVLLSVAALALLGACGSEAPDGADKAPAAEMPVAEDARGAAPEQEPEAPADAPEPRPLYTLETLVPGGLFKGIHGLTFTREGRLLVGSVVGHSIYDVDPETGESTVYLGPPLGMADDIEQGPDGTLVWTAFSDGKVYAQAPDGPVVTIAEGLPGTNSLAFAPDGRLFFTQVFAGDALYEADPTGETPPRLIMEGMGGLNGFDFGPDGMLYGPLWFKGQVVRVDVDAGTLETVADGFGIPAAVNFDSTGTLYAVDTERGEVVRVEIETGGKTVVAQAPKAIDNLAFSADDRLFLTVMAENAVYEVNTDDGTLRKVVSSPLSNAADIVLVNRDGAQTLYVATAFAVMAVDVATGELREVGRVFDQDALVDYPIALGADENGLVVVASFASSSLQPFDSATEALGPIYHEMPAVTDALPHNGAILFLDVAAGALKRAYGEDYAEIDTIADALAGPVSLIMGTDGAAYVSEYGGAITRIDLDTGEKTNVADDLQGPEGLAFAGAGLLGGQLVVAEAGARRIIAIDLESGARTIVAEDLPLGLMPAENAPPMNLTTGVAVTASGDILFSSDLDSAIYRLTPSKDP
ncbi:MAG: SMP-30/gluconolactonase/LRE family protein [Alphaproteobacteria bacterium]